MPDLETERWEGHRREHVLAFTDMERRLEKMNELREQINQERGNYLPRTDFEPRHDVLINRISALEQARSNVEGRIWAVGAIGGALIFVLEFGLHFLHV